MQSFTFHKQLVYGEREPSVQGVCKDCGNGTLNNELNPAFDFNGNDFYCIDCGSTHLDLVQF